MSNTNSNKRKTRKPRFEICDNCPSTDCSRCPTYIRLIDALGCD